MILDVEAVRSRRPLSSPLATRGHTLLAESPTVTPMSFAVSLPSVEVRIATVEIRDAASNQLVTSIEILSPVNKREPGLGKYTEKLRRLRAANVHILEIDLLRRGQRLHNHPHIPTSAYRVMLMRAGSALAQVWAVDLADLLPVVPVPLRTPDADIPLDLGLALRALYDAAAYDLSIDYTQPPPPPPLSSDEEAWIQTLLEHPQ